MTFWAKLGMMVLRGDTKVRIIIVVLLGLLTGCGRAGSLAKADLLGTWNGPAGVKYVFTPDAVEYGDGTTVCTSQAAVENDNWIVIEPAACTGNARLYMKMDRTASGAMTLGSLDTLGKGLVKVVRQP